jgi:cellulose biosynthesis protein BcsQ
VAILDAAVATQGLSDYLSGRLDPDLTALVTDRRDTPLAAGLVDVSIGVESGRLACCPAAAPFERLARAKSVESARSLESRIAAAAEAFDHVLVDTPPVAANQSVAAVRAADAVGLVAPSSTRGRDAVQRMRGRLDDLGVAVDAVVSTRGELSVADAAFPETTAAVRAAPACLDDRSVATAVADVAEAVFHATPSPAADRSLLDSVGEFVSR